MNRYSMMLVLNAYRIIPTLIVERRFEGGEKSDLISEELPLRLYSQICDSRLLES